MTMEPDYDPSLSDAYWRTLELRWPEFAGPELRELVRPMNDNLTRWLEIVSTSLLEPGTQRALHHYRPDAPATGVPPRILCGSIPGDEVNAWVRRVGDGYLILVSNMLANMLYSFVHLVLSTTSIDDTGEASTFGGYENGLLTVDEAAHSARLLLTQEDPDAGDQLFLSNDPMMAVAKELAQQCFGFVVAHEVSHVVLGHLGGTQVVSEDFYVDPAIAPHLTESQAAAVFSKAQEVAADDLAQAIMSGWHASGHTFYEGMPGGPPDYRFAACVLFFGFLEALEFRRMGGWEGYDSTMGAFVADRPLSTHSLPRVRRNICIHQNRSRLDPAGLPYVSSLSVIIDRVAGRERFARDAVAIEIMKNRAAAASIVLAERFQFHTLEVAGFSGVDITGLRGLIARDLDTAIDCVSLAAAEYWNSIELYGEIPQARTLVQLAISIVLFESSYSSLANDESDDLQHWRKVLAAALPEAHYIVEGAMGEVMWS